MARVQGAVHPAGTPETASPPGWPVVPLGDYASLTKGLSYKSTFLNEDGPDLIGLGQFVPGGGAKLEGGRTYAGEYRERDVARPGDILIAMTDLTQRGDVLGSPLMVPRSVGDFCLYTLDAGKLDPDASVDARFLYYMLKSRDFRAFAAAHATGTTVRRVRPVDVLAYEFVLPPLEEQRAIARVLGALDDKIELNRRMSETLEEMARALFRSWFVDFDPVRAKAKGRPSGLPPDLDALFPASFEASELGEIPAGWEVRALREFGTIVTGKTPSTKRSEHFGHDVPFLRIPDMRGKMYVLRTRMMLSHAGADSQRPKTLPPGSVSVSCIATPGLVVLNHRVVQTNQQINTVVPHDGLMSRYLFWSCRNLSRDIEVGGRGGSVLGNMNKSAFSALPVLDAPPEVVRAFDELVDPLHSSTLTIEYESEALAQTRDTVLPRLVSGELPVRAQPGTP